MATPPITIGELVDVPAPGSGVKSPWAQEATNRIVHRFANVAERDSKWPAATAGRGAMCVTFDTETLWKVALVSTVPTWLPASPGAEILNSAIAANANITATSAATAQAFISAPAVTFDGQPAMFEFFASQLTTPNVTGGALVINLWDGSTDLGIWGQVITITAGQMTVAETLRRRLTPTAGSHTFSVRGWVTPSGTGIVGAGATMPAFLRATRV